MRDVLQFMDAPYGEQIADISPEAQTEMFSATSEAELAPVVVLDLPDDEYWQVETSIPTAAL